MKNKHTSGLMVIFSL